MPIYNAGSTRRKMYLDEQKLNSRSSASLRCSRKSFRQSAFFVHFISWIDDLYGAMFEKALNEDSPLQNDI